MMLLAGVLAGLILPAAVQAQTGAPANGLPGPGSGGQGRVRVLRLPTEVVLGTRHAPGVVLLLDRTRVDYHSPLPARTLAPEILQSVQRSPF
jgi:hypothetical protein